MRLSLILLLLTFPAFASAPCTDLDANYHAGSDVITSDGACKVWFCSANHQWTLVYICGTWQEMTGAAIAHIASMRLSSQAQRDTEWDALAAITPVAGSADDRLAKAAQAMPLPLDAPIDGWVTQDTKLYKRQDALNGYTVVQVGTVGLGIPCDAKTYLSDTIGVRYYAVSRDDPSIKYTKVGLFTVPKPIAAFARCN